MFLLLSVYCAARLVGGGRRRWLWLAALALGVCVSGRPAELSILPGFVGLWLGLRRWSWVNVGKVTGALALFVLPFAFSVGYVLLREDAAYLHARDDALRDRILSADADAGRHPGWQQLPDAAYYSLGLKWTRIDTSTTEDASGLAARYGDMLTGRAALDSSDAPKTPSERELGVGVGLGALGIVLAVAGIVCYWRQPGWVLLGLGLFMGNLAFILWHPQEDALTFTTPGLAGLAFLAGLGAAGPPNGTRQKWWKRIALPVGALASAFLLVANYRVVDRSTPEERARQAYYQHVAAAPFPRDSAILTKYWSAMTLRYLLHIEAGRTDVRVVRVREATWRRVAEYFRNQETPAFIPPDLSRSLGRAEQRLMRRRTPSSISQLGLLRLTSSDGGQR
jgi:hypothetical protein